MPSYIYGNLVPRCAPSRVETEGNGTITRDTFLGFNESWVVEDGWQDAEFDLAEQEEYFGF